MPNLSRAEMEEMQDALISAQDGVITSTEHRAFNSAMMDFTNSFLPADLEVNGAGDDPDEDGSYGSITDESLEKRDVSTVVLIEGNVVITSTGFAKETNSDTLYFRGSNYVVEGTPVVINFKRT